MNWTYDELFPERRSIYDHLEARMIGPLPCACEITPGLLPDECPSMVVKTKMEWKLIDQGVQPHRKIILQNED